MGGKTQQRVAGNVKPSSSGRIRELLINTSGATGNVITFSALSNASKSRTGSNSSRNNNCNIDSNQTSTKPSTKPQESPQPKQESPDPVQSSPTSGLKQTLVVKRVGNRDYFTRVRVPSGEAPNSDQSPKVFRMPESSFHDNYDEDANEISDKIRQQSLEDEPQAGSSSVSKEEGPDEAEVEEEPEEFDSLVDRLSEADGKTNKTLDSYIQIIDIVQLMIKHYKQDMSIEEWDSIGRTLNECTSQIISKFAKNLPGKMVGGMLIKFCVKVFDLIYQLITLAKSNEEFPMKQLVVDDWNNFNSSPLFRDLVQLYFRIAGAENLDEALLDVVASLAKVLVEVDSKFFVAHMNPGEIRTVKLDLEPELEIPENTIYCRVDEATFKGFKSACSLLTSIHRVVLVSGHSILKKVISQICDSVQKISDDLDNLTILPPKELMTTLITRDAMMSVLLSDYRARNISVTVDPQTDSYTCALSYLLIWDLVIDYIVECDKELGHHMMHCLKKLGLIQRVLDTVFMLIPPLGERDALNFGETGYTNQCLSTFLKMPLKAGIERPVNEIELIALHIYFSFALHMPVSVRKWFNNNSNKRICNMVSEYTVKHISKVVCSMEMETVQEKCQERANQDKMRNLVIKARSSSKEVYAAYERDEFKMELTIRLPHNYPLGPVQIDGGKRVGVTDVKWRSWLLQLTTFLSHQNGPILDGIDLWRRNIDKRFEGVEKCMICFSILHSNYQLPRKKCRTCSKMFHGFCIYKWFETSHNTTCPMCREIW